MGAGRAVGSAIVILMTRRTARALLLLIAFATSCQARETVTVDTELSGRIERLTETFLTSGDEAAKTSALSEARAIFERDGIPSLAKVGDTAAYDFVVLNMLGQPPDMQLPFYAKLQQPKVREGLPADAVAFANARRRQMDVEARFKTQSPSHPEIRDRIVELIKDDQAVRQTEGFDLEKMGAVDRRTAGPLKAILDRHGVPTYDMVGVQAAKDFVIIVQHQAPEFRRAVLPKLKANVDAGQAAPGVYALVYDRTQRDEGRNQLYGQQLECTKAGVIDVAPLDDAANVNSRRAELGLIRLELYTRVVRLTSPACDAFRPPRSPHELEQTRR